MANTERVELTEEGWGSLHEELLRLRAWVAAEARERYRLARAAEPGVLSFEYLQLELVRLDRRIARLEQAAEGTDSPGLADREAA